MNRPQPIYIFRFFCTYTNECWQKETKDHIKNNLTTHTNMTLSHEELRFILVCHVSEQVISNEGCSRFLIWCTKTFGATLQFIYNFFVLTISLLRHKTCHKATKLLYAIYIQMLLNRRDCLYVCLLKTYTPIQPSYERNL